MYGSGGPDDVTERFGPDPFAETEVNPTEVNRIDVNRTDVNRTGMNRTDAAPSRTSWVEDERTVVVGTGDETAGYTVPHLDRASTSIPVPHHQGRPKDQGRPPALPQRIPVQPGAFASSGDGMSPSGTGSSIRIGKGVVPPATSSRLRDARSTSRRWLGRATRIVSGLVTIVLIGAVAWTAWQWWHHVHDRAAVESVTVAPAQLFNNVCNVQYDIVGTIATNGRPGTIAYEWVRSDGQRSGTLEQSVSSGQTSATVHLYWKFTGRGSMNATATLHVLRPTVVDGSAQFRYSCA